MNNAYYLKDESFLNWKFSIWKNLNLTVNLHIERFPSIDIVCDPMNLIVKKTIELSAEMINLKIM